MLKENKPGTAQIGAASMAQTINGRRLFLGKFRFLGKMFGSITFLLSWNYRLKCPKIISKSLFGTIWTGITKLNQFFCYIKKRSFLAGGVSAGPNSSCGGQILRNCKFLPVYMVKTVLSGFWYVFEKLCGREWWSHEILLTRRRKRSEFFDLEKTKNVRNGLFSKILLKRHDTKQFSKLERIEIYAVLDSKFLNIEKQEAQSHCHILHQTGTQTTNRIYNKLFSTQNKVVD